MMTLFMVLLALGNGVLIVTNRVINAKLGSHVSGAGAAFWNHLVGCLFLALIVPFITVQGTITLTGIPVYLFLGGLIGAGYVAINSWVMTKAGATKATVLVIAGQIVLSTIIDVSQGKISNLTITVIGISLVILGMWLGSHKPKSTAPQSQKYPLQGDTRLKPSC